MAQTQPRNKSNVAKPEVEATAVVASLDVHEPEPVKGKVPQRTTLHDGTIREDY